MSMLIPMVGSIWSWGARFVSWPRLGRSKPWHSVAGPLDQVQENQEKDHTRSWVSSWGYLIIFFGPMLETVIAVVPGEIVLLVAGYLLHAAPKNSPTAAA